MKAPAPAARLSLLFVIGSIAAVGGASSPPPLPDQNTFLQQFRSTLQTGWLLPSGYSFRETRTELRLNDDGIVIGKSVKVLDRPEPLDRESAAQRERRLRTEVDACRKENEIVEEAFRLYDFRLVGREPRDGHDAILFTFAPAAGPSPRGNEGKLLQKFSGRAWVAEADHQLIRVEAQAIDEVTMGFGLLARFEKGSQVVFQRRKVSDTVWLPSELRYSVGGRVLLVKKLRIEGLREFSNYKALSGHPTN